MKRIFPALVLVACGGFSGTDSGTGSETEKPDGGDAVAEADGSVTVKATVKVCGGCPSAADACCVPDAHHNFYNKGTCRSDGCNSEEIELGCDDSGDCPAGAVCRVDIDLAPRYLLRTSCQPAGGAAVGEQLCKSASECASKACVQLKDVLGHEYNPFVQLYACAH